MRKKNASMLDVKTIRKDFPILNRSIKGKPLVYLDNAATSQTPKQVVEAIVTYYENYNANIHRGVHTLSQEATEKFETSRKIIQHYFNAKQAHEIIFTSGATHSINIIASGYASILKPGDEVIVSAMEHHSNIVPWQMLCEKTGAVLNVIPMDYNGELELVKYDELLNNKTKLVFVNHVSNALGTINPINFIIKKAHRFGAKVVVDGAQASPHIQIDVQQTDVDFYVASAHKMYGPTGIGVLYGKEPLLNELPPFQGGGEMIDEVTFTKTTYAALPHKLEAGTPNISGAIAFGVAIKYLETIGIKNIATHERELLDYATKKLQAIEGLTIYGKAPNKTAVISFNLEGIHAYDVGTILDKLGIAVRTGHHCAQPIMDFYNISGTVRASFAMYTTKAEIDALVKGVLKAKMMLQ